MPFGPKPTTHRPLFRQEHRSKAALIALGGSLVVHVGLLGGGLFSGPTPRAVSTIEMVVLPKKGAGLEEPAKDQVPEGKKGNGEAAGAAGENAQPERQRPKPPPRFRPKPRPTPPKKPAATAPARTPRPNAVVLPKPTPAKRPKAPSRLRPITKSRLRARADLLRAGKRGQKPSAGNGQGRGHGASGDGKGTGNGQSTRGDGDGRGAGGSVGPIKRGEPDAIYRCSARGLEEKIRVRVQRPFNEWVTVIPTVALAFDARPNLLDYFGQTIHVVSRDKRQLSRVGPGELGIPATLLRLPLEQPSGVTVLLGRPEGRCLVGFRWTKDLFPITLHRVPARFVDRARHTVDALVDVEFHADATFKVTARDGTRLPVRKGRLKNAGAIAANIGTHYGVANAVKGVASWFGIDLGAEDRKARQEKAKRRRAKDRAREQKRREEAAAARKAAAHQRKADQARKNKARAEADKRRTLTPRQRARLRAKQRARRQREQTE